MNHKGAHGGTEIGAILEKKIVEAPMVWGKSWAQFSLGFLLTQGENVLLSSPARSHFQMSKDNKALERSEHGLMKVKLCLIRAFYKEIISQ